MQSRNDCLVPSTRLAGGQGCLRRAGISHVAMEHAGSLAPLIAKSGIGEEIYELAAEIFPICRSITGDGVRGTIDILTKHVPFQHHEIPTGTAVLDWEIPKEWNITDAYIKNAQGERLLDFHLSNLHVLSYSAPVSSKDAARRAEGAYFYAPRPT